MKGPRYTWRQYARAAGLYGCLWVVAACTQCGWLSARVETASPKAGRDQAIGTGNASGNTVTTSAPIASGNRIATTMTAEVGSGNTVTTTQRVEQSGPVNSPTTQSAAAQAGEHGTASAETASGEGSKSNQTGALNFNWAPVAVGGGGAFATAALWLAWGSRNQKREIDARLRSEQLDLAGDRALLQTTRDIVRDAHSLAMRSIDKLR